MNTHNFKPLARRNLLKQIGGLSALAMVPTLGSSTTKDIPDSVKKSIDYDLDDPKDQLLIFEKLKGDISGKLTYSYSEGRVFGIRPDQPDDLNMFGKEVFKYTGCGMSIKRVLDNGNVETKSKGWLLYQDPNTLEFIKEMTNPYTKDKVDVPPFRAGIRGGVQTPQGPVMDANFKMESTAFDRPLGLQFNFIGNNAHVTRHAFTKWFESKSQTWRTEFTLDTYDFEKSMLNDRSRTHIPSHSHWTSETSWLSLLNMAGTPGHQLWTSNGAILHSTDDIPETFLAATKERQPDIFSEPLNWD